VTSFPSPGKRISGQDLSPVITDNFVLIPNPGICDPNKTYRVEFKANIASLSSAE
jgi:hypothetical protein